MDLERDMNGKRKTGKWVWELVRSGESLSRIDIDTVESDGFAQGVAPKRLVWNRQGIIRRWTPLRGMLRAKKRRMGRWLRS